jgi:serine/threonine-protein kinase PknG
MQTGSSLKLIDLGGVYRMDDASSPIYGTRGFQAPEIATTGPTVPSDLFTVGRTLAVLCTDFRGYQSAYEFDLPPQDEVPVYTAYDSLYRFLLRATDSHPDNRFQSADEMADQLYGVLREVVSQETGEPVVATSTLFTSELRGAGDQLPALLIARDDPAAGYLAALASTGASPSALADELAHPPVASVEVELRRAGALIEAGHGDEAAAVLAQVEAADEWEWRVNWYRGLLALSRDDPAVAIAAFERVYRTWPGELAPRLALGVAHERAGHFGAAAALYDVVSRTDPGFTSAIFGLARCRLALGDKANAIGAYDRVAPASSAFTDARLAKVEALLDPMDGPPFTDVVAAGSIVSSLTLSAEPRARLTALVFAAAVTLLRDAPPPQYPADLLGQPVTEAGARRGLERAYREMARHAGSAEERITLTDRANDARSRSWW